jgi:hypothetical protein
MTKLAEVYEREGEWYFQPSSKTVNGYWITTPPVIQLHQHDSHQRKGEAALEVLRASTEGVPTPTDPNWIPVPLFSKAGVWDWSAFMQTAKCVGIELEQEQLTITPHEQIPESGGALEGIAEKAIMLPVNASLEEIGAALEKAMGDCK